MKRFAAHYLYCNPHQIICNGFVEVDDDAVLLDIYSLNDIPQESHSTVFYNGILLPFRIDLKKAIASESNMFDVIRDQYSNEHINLIAGEKVEIYLLENLDLVNKLFLKETVLSQLL